MKEVKEKSERYLKVKLFIKSIKPHTWFFIGGITLFMIIGLICGIIAIYSCGYDLASWLAKFYPWVIISFSFIIAIVCSIIFLNYLKGK